MNSILFKHTLRNILLSRKSILMIAISGLPILISIIFRLTKHNTRQVTQFLPTISMTLYLMFVTTLIALFYATAIISDEIENQTLQFLLMRPIRRSEILISKFLAYVFGAILLILPSHLITTILISTHPKMPESVLINIGKSFHFVTIMILGVLAYGAIFLLFAVVFKRPVLWGLTIVFGWEKIAIGVPANIRRISIIHYLLSIFPKSELPKGDFSDVFQRHNTANSISITILLLITIVIFLITNRIFREKQF